MKYLSIAMMALSLATGPMSFADNHDKPCKCTKKCQEQCEKGDHKDCKCECGCKEGKCTHGKCHHDHGDAAAPKK